MNRVTRWLLMGLLLTGFVCPAQQFPVDTLQKTGPTDRRINVVMVGDGFTPAEQGAFRQAAQKFMVYFLSDTPYQAYRNYFNFFAIEVPSEQSGATNPGTAPDRYTDQPVETKNTYFGATFGTSNIHRLVTIRNYTALTNVLATNFPTYDQVVIIVNSPWYGGSGGSVATFTLNTSASQIGTHEIGHSFARLADEYWAGTDYAREAANMTRNTDPTTVVWKSWLNQFNVGLFRHTGGTDAGSWFKPTDHNCLMEQLNRPFCAVCREATTNRILQLVKPVETITPAPNARISLDDQPVTFRLSLLKPDPNTLRVEWRLNNRLIRQDSTSLTLSADQLTDRENRLSVSVFDSTSYVRLADHRQKHTYTYQWTLDNARIAPAFTVTASRSAVCVGDSVTLTAVNCAGSVTWPNRAVTPTFTASPTESVTYTATCVTAGVAQTATIGVGVLSRPVAQASNTGPYVEGQTLQLSAQGGSAYQWSGPDGFAAYVPNASRPNLKQTHAGTYRVTVTGTNACVSTATTIVRVDPLLPVLTLPAERVRVFPNPTQQGRFQIQTTLDGPLFVTLFDGAGREVLRQPFQRSTTLTVRHLPKATYVYRISDESSQRSVTGKIMVVD